MKREREKRGGYVKETTFVDGDFGTVAVLVVARVRPGQGSEEAYDAVAPAVGIYAQLRRSNKDGRKKERGGWSEMEGALRGEKDSAEGRRRRRKEAERGWYAAKLWAGHVVRLATIPP